MKCWLWLSELSLFDRDLRMNNTNFLGFEMQKFDQIGLTKLCSLSTIFEGEDLDVRRLLKSQFDLISQLSVPKLKLSTKSHLKSLHNLLNHTH